jgi:L-ribulose-5-phosphate 4-epimerase
MMDEGVIKFNCNWQPGELPHAFDCTELLLTRNEMFRLGLIGYDEAQKVGYGNISSRIVGNQFIISGTQTGHIAVLSEKELSLVTETIIDTNTVYCSGPSKASSESMTHAAIYQLIPTVNAVIHIHNNAMWEKLKHQLPTTKADIGYGTQAMANEIERLLKDNDLLTHRLLVMAGHKDGIISFGETMEAAAQVLLKNYT